MVSPLIVLALISNLQACTPSPTLLPNMPAAYRATTTTMVYRHAPARSRILVKREPEKVIVTVVSNQKYDPSRNTAHLQVFRNLVDASTKYMNIVYDKNRVKDQIINSDGKFGVRYTLNGFDCGRVTKFLEDTVNSAIFITSVKIKCGNRPETVLK
ncbi:unnamed protein product [Cylicocyclus nassatus]|uniref:Uncharacterized protein n=1 Tax=Cylicocyclus nassatus TaxID=53992 RepID=A0AA36M6F3_CYLNA|nr:unnamed protein product [Cylicocyclus nassatus]